MIEKLQVKKEATDAKNHEMKDEIKTLIGTIKEMEIALNAKGAEAIELAKKFQTD